MSDGVIELVLLRLRPGVSDEAFLSAAERTTRLLKGCPGVRRRRLAKGQNGQWLDDVEWASLDDALAAAKLFATSDVARPFMDAIEPSSVTRATLRPAHQRSYYCHDRPAHENRGKFPWGQRPRGGGPPSPAECSRHAPFTVT